MRIYKRLLAAAITSLFFVLPATAQTDPLAQQSEEAMLRATKFMEDEVSTQGGFVWYYKLDLSRRWGEMEAYKTMIWVQDGGTVTVGHMLLDAYHATGNQYFYQSAEKAAAALIRGQNIDGGWNYMIDFAGDKSLKNWYNTIGKNGWRLEEFQHYYGNSTYDDDVSSDAARFLLRIYLEKMDSKYKPALDKAIQFLLNSQYPNGGWPQRYPHKSDFNKAGHPDYTSYYTFNDDVIWENVNFLIQCYVTLGEERFLDPINRGMNFYLISQKGNGAWGQQHNMQMEPAGARTYEPAAYSPRTTFANAMLLLKFYQFTGDRKYIARVPDAISWLEKVKLPSDMNKDGRYTHPLFVELGTDKPIFVHRKGSNVTYGYYYVDYDDSRLLSHMLGKGFINIQMLKDEYAKLNALSPEELTKDSPLKRGKFEGQGHSQKYYPLNREGVLENRITSKEKAQQIVSALDKNNRWLVKHVMISNPYIGDGQKKDSTNEFASTRVGDETDTSPYTDISEELYISTPEYIRNMYQLINYIKSTKQQKAVNK